MLNCIVADILEQNKFDNFLEVFVDNLFILLLSAREILPAADKVVKIFSSASMPLHEFASNCPNANKVFSDKGLLTGSPLFKCAWTILGICN